MFSPSAGGATKSLTFTPKAGRVPEVLPDSRPGRGVKEDVKTKMLTDMAAVEEKIMKSSKHVPESLSYDGSRDTLDDFV